MPLTLADVDDIAAQAHAGQVDKIDVPYIEHVRAVSAGLAPFGTGMQMAGLLHDTLEDTALTPELLLHAGVPHAVVATVRRVTNRPGVPYAEMIDGISGDLSACLLKVADNAHNSHPGRTARLPEEKRVRLADKYRQARSLLWGAVPREDVEQILRIVNPALLTDGQGHVGVVREFNEYGYVVEYPDGSRDGVDRLGRDRDYAFGQFRAVQASCAAYDFRHVFVCRQVTQTPWADINEGEFAS
jgi:hypothetical protein